MVDRRREQSDVRQMDGEELQQREHTQPEEVSEETEAPLKTRRLFKRRKERLLQTGRTPLAYFREAVLTAANRKRGLLRRAGQGVCVHSQGTPADPHR